MLDRNREQQTSAITPVGTAILAAFTLVVVYLCWRMVAPFVNVLTWAVALAIMVNPVTQRLRRRWSETTTATLVVSLVVTVLILVGGFLSQRLINEVIRGQQTLRTSLQPGAWQRALATQPWLAAIWQWLGSRIDLPALAQQASAAIAPRLAAGVSASAVIISETAMSLFVLFFLVRDEEKLGNTLRGALPLTRAEIDEVWERVSSAIRASVYGRVLIGAIQGLLGGVIFFALGLPAPLFWAIVMGVLSMLPVVGAFVVWVPAAIFLLVTGHWVRAVILAAFAIGVIHTIDNVLYPILVGPRIGLHPIVLLIALLGGVVAFGAAGLILGPGLVALALALGDLWTHRATSEPLPAADG